MSYFYRQLQKFADFAAGHHQKLAQQYNAASEFRRCQHLYNLAGQKKLSNGCSFSEFRDAAT